MQHVQKEDFYLKLHKYVKTRVVRSAAAGQCIRYDGIRRSIFDKCHEQSNT